MTIIIMISFDILYFSTFISISSGIAVFNCKTYSHFINRVERFQTKNHRVIMIAAIIIMYTIFKCIRLDDLKETFFAGLPL